MSDHWDGVERRATPANLSEIWEVLQEIRTKQELQFQADSELRPKLQEVITILERSKGVITFLKIILYIGAPAAAFATWAKDHIKW